MTMMIMTSIVISPRWSRLRGLCLCILLTSMPDFTPFVKPFWTLHSYLE